MLETVIIFMVAVFSFCFLLSTLTLSSHTRVKLEKIKIASDVEVDAIVEDYLKFNQTLYTSLAGAWEREATETVETPTLQSFEDFIEDDQIFELSADYERYNIHEIRDLDENGKKLQLTLNVSDKSTGAPVVSMCIRYTLQGNFLAQEILYINKSPQTTTYPQGNE